jgi:hypothetical protein
MCLILPCLVLGLPIILSIFGEDNYEQFQYVSIVNNKKCFVDPKSKVILKSVRILNKNAKCKQQEIYIKN